MTSFHDNLSETIVKAIVHKRNSLVFSEECLFDKQWTKLLISYVNVINFICFRFIRDMNVNSLGSDTVLLLSVEGIQ